MTRTRSLALAVMVASAVFVSGFCVSDLNVKVSVDPLASASSPADSSVAQSRSNPSSVTAVEPGRPLVLARSEARYPMRMVFTVLVAVLLACAVIGRRGRRLGQVRELLIRAQSAFNGPSPGRRAPPLALAV